MDILSLVIGFAIGVVVVGLALEIGMKKTSRSAPNTRRTNKWSLSEIANPRIMAEYLAGDVELPKDSKVIVHQYKDEDMLTGLEVKKHSGIKGNYIVGDDRALILSGPIKKDEVGIWTIEKEIVDKLNEEFNAMWGEGTVMKQEEDKK